MSYVNFRIFDIVKNEFGATCNVEVNLNVHWGWYYNLKTDVCVMC